MRAGSRTRLTIVTGSLLLASLPFEVGAAPRPKCFGQTATIEGTAGNDNFLTGTPGRDVIVGKGGADTIDGLDGNDLICGGRGGDYLTGSAGADKIRGDRGTDTLAGIGGRDLLNGGANGDTLFGHGANDRLHGGGAQDKLSGGGGDDDLKGGLKTDFADYFFSPSSVDVDLASGIATGHGSDTLVSIESIGGSEFSDVLRGNAKTNHVFAGNGDDHMFGRRGDDFLHGQSGDLDQAIGGPGNDYCDAEAFNCESP